MSNGTLPSYISMAKPNPPENRAPWYKNTAPTYAGIFLWFVFWMGATGVTSAGGVLSHGVWAPIASLALAALLCYVFYYVILGVMGQKTGLPLYIVGTSTFGTQGGFILPGFLMGLLQFGWLGVNTYASSVALAEVIPIPSYIIMVVFGALAAFMGLKGIQYVAKVSTWLPLIPFAALIIMFLATVKGISSFDADAFVNLHQDTVGGVAPAIGSFGLASFMLVYVIGFFATAGAAGVDFGTNSRNENDVHMGGIVGIVAAIIFTAGLAILIVAGAYGRSDIAEKVATAYAADEAAEAGTGSFPLDAFYLIPVVLGGGLGKLFFILLPIAAFPAACFSSLIAANSFKTTLPKVNPFISVGIGAAVAIILALTGYAGRLVPVFNIIGASFGPICGAMAVDYIMNGCKWAGPRKGINYAGWLAWGVGFMLGIMPNLGVPLPMNPFWAMVAGAVVYFIMAKAGLEPPVVEMSADSAQEEKKE